MTPNPEDEPVLMVTSAGFPRFDAQLDEFHQDTVIAQARPGSWPYDLFV